ncbi:MAG: PEP-CTERM sorting domain-containing protein [Kiritimatiellia bacterium]
MNSTRFLTTPLRLLGLTALLATASVSHGAILTTFDFTGDSLAAANEAVNTSSTDIAAGSDVNNTVGFSTSGSGSTDGTATTGIFSGGSSNTVTLANTSWANGLTAANTAGQYFEFTINADSGYTIDLTHISYGATRISGTPPRTTGIFIKTSKEISFTERGSKALSSTSTMDDNDYLNVDLSGLGTDFTGVTSATFRIVMADDSTGRTGTGAIDNIALQGAVVIPEPSTFALMGLFGLAALMAYRRRR